MGDIDPNSRPDANAMDHSNQYGFANSNTSNATMTAQQQRPICTANGDIPPMQNMYQQQQQQHNSEPNMNPNISARPVMMPGEATTMVSAPMVSMAPLSVTQTPMVSSPQHPQQQLQYFPVPKNAPQVSAPNAAVTSTAQPARSAGGAGAASAATTADPWKRKMIREQFALLIHAHKCPQLESPTNRECTLPHCRPMKNVLNHMKTCQTGNSCQIPHCSYARQIISHCKNCNRPDCPICLPINQVSRNKAPHNNSQPSPAGFDVGLGSNSTGGSSVTPDQSVLPAHNQSAAVGAVQVPSITARRLARPRLRQRQQNSIVPMNSAQLAEDNPPSAISASQPVLPGTLNRGPVLNTGLQSQQQASGPTGAGPRNIRDAISDNASNIEHIMSPVNSTTPLPGGLQLSQVTADSVQGSKEWHQSMLPKRKEQQQAQQTPTSTPTTPLQQQAPSALTHLPPGQQVPPPQHHQQQPVPPSNNAGLRPNMPGTGESGQGPRGIAPTSGMMMRNPAPSPVGTEQSSRDQEQHRSERRTPNGMPSTNSQQEIKPSGGFGGGNSDSSGTMPGLSGSASNTSSAVAIPPIVRPKKAGKIIFSPDELRQALMPTLEKLYRQDPDSILFRDPVDPHKLGIPDYFDIIKKPMDLATIRRKIDNGQYKNPWEYVDDVWLMFNNAWLYNRKSSRVYRCCTKLSKVFEQEIDPVMQSLGYCCGRKYAFNPQVLCCYGKQLCSIPRDAKYFSYHRYTYCLKCFNDIPGDTVSLGDDPTQPPTVIRKEQFTELKNDALDLEPFVDCGECGRKLHQICVLHMDCIWPQGFTCANCLKARGDKPKENKYGAKQLPTTKLSTFIENRVNSFLKKKEAGAGEVTIRVVASAGKITEVKPGMKSRFADNGEMCETFPYRAKALFAFEEIDGTDVCFFGMHVQEYGSDSPSPNTRRVYLAYLDSVHFFQPKQFRTAVYHEILLGYLDYVKQLGYCMAHIWACPPSQGDDYIFHCHPPDQRIPKPKQLQDWYKKMLDRGITEQIVLENNDILKQSKNDNLKSAAELPYFEGDFWPNVLEESIQEIEEKRRKQKSNKAKANNRKNNKKSNAPQTDNDLWTKIFTTMKKQKEVFFVIRLQTVQAAASLGPVVDPDPLIQCDLMDGRDAFLALARDKHYEFSSLRRCKYSSMAMLYNLHNQGTDSFVYTCNDCKSQVETRFHCTVCDDFDLCVPCYEKDGHHHKMEKLGFDLDDGSKQANPPEAGGKLPTQRCIQHAKHCTETKCMVPFCLNIRQQHQHAHFHKRRMACLQLLQLLKPPSSPQLQQQVVQILRSNPQLMADIIKQHAVLQQQHPQQQQQSVGGMGAVNPAMVMPPPQMMQHTRPMNMQPGGMPGNTVGAGMQVNQVVGGPSGPNAMSGMGGNGGMPINNMQGNRMGMGGEQQWGGPRFAGPAQGGAVPNQVMGQQQQMRPMAPNNMIGAQQQQQPGQASPAMSMGNSQGGMMGPGGGVAGVGPNVAQQQQQVNAVQQQPQAQLQPGILTQIPVGAGGITVPGGAQRPLPQALHQLLQTLKPPSSPQLEQQVVQILRSNPQLMADIIKQHAVLQQQHPQQQQQSVGGMGAVNPAMVMLPPQMMQHTRPMNMQPGGMPGNMVGAGMQVNQVVGGPSGPNAMSGMGGNGGMPINNMQGNRMGMGGEQQWGGPRFAGPAQGGAVPNQVMGQQQQMRPMAPNNMIGAQQQQQPGQASPAMSMGNSQGGMMGPGGGVAGVGPNVAQQQQQVNAVQQQPQAQLQPGILMQIPVGAVGITVPGGAQRPLPQALHQLVQTLKSPSTPQQYQQVVQILRSNPQLMAAFIKQRSVLQQQQQQNQNQQPQQGQQQVPNQQGQQGSIPNNMQAMAQLGIQAAMQNTVTFQSNYLSL